MVRRTDLVQEILREAPIKIGDSNKAVVVFFDLRCPFCARLFRESESYFVELARGGAVTYAMCDYIVHDDAVPLHLMLREVNGVEKRLKLIEDIYSGKVKARGKERNKGIACHKLAEELGVFGTPSLLLYDLARGEGKLFSGYIPLALIKDIIFKFL
ncbi:MAG: DsbA family protein [Thermoproteus sp. AZ2]|uniref:DsbA family protein n=1 Tax=Thermoproteus sp. AZ2 TaxID=1609232 RepID=A0ACC6UZH8_9CREN